MTYTWPLPEGTPISQPFGSNPNNGVNPPGGHTGTDFAVPVGTPVRAIADGTVKFADWANTLPADYRPDGSGPNPYWLAPSFGGIVVVIDHGPVVTVHAHLSQTSLSAGDSVKQGQVIALSGNTGGATSGPHLHFETLPDGWNFQNGTYGRVDPATYCTAYWTGVALAATNVTPIASQEDDLSYSQWPQADKDALKADLYNTIWGGGSGLPLVHNYRLDRGEWPGTILGSLENRFRDEILAPALADIKALVSSPQAATDAAAVVAEIAKRLNQTPAA